MRTFGKTLLSQSPPQVAVAHRRQNYQSV
uniref:Uncharacterized protein n=1 Tax=Nelumbo nucifera TaxID=4432 RepID=A0A822ZZZ8_NELNU|nr:TPA_asm: hypothetical protein HUJ06_018872 [Nelumbo nucifera]